MSVVGDLVQGAVDSALKEILRKTTGTNKRARRRKRTTTASRSTVSSRTLREIEKLLRPHKQQVSRKKSTLTRSKVQKRRVAASTQAHRRSLRRGASVR